MGLLEILLELLGILLGILLDLLGILLDVLGFYWNVARICTRGLLGIASHTVDRVLPTFRTFLGVLVLLSMLVIRMTTCFFSG